MSEMARIDTGVKLEMEKFNSGEFFGVLVEALGLVLLVLATREPAAFLQLYVASGRMFCMIQKPLCGQLGQACCKARAFLPF